MITKTTNHEAEALANLVAQFKDKPQLAALLKVYVSQIQDLENALFQILESTVDTATGVTLDGFGDIVSQPREGRTDSFYRQIIKARIRLNASNGTPEDLIAIVRAVVGDKEIEVVEDFPGHFDLYINDPILAGAQTVSGFVQLGKPAGVRGITHFHTATPYFGFLGDPNAAGFGVGAFGTAQEE